MTLKSRVHFKLTGSRTTVLHGPKKCSFSFAVIMVVSLETVLAKEKLDNLLYIPEHEIA